MAKVYVASSWRNERYPRAVQRLREMGHRVWDWRAPPTGGNGFRWQDAGKPDFQHGDVVSAWEWAEMLERPTAVAGFASDLAGMNWCDVGLLLHPCGRSAHLEAGWMAGRGKTVHVLAFEAVEPDLMVLALAGKILGSWTALEEALEGK
jgi:hypothetical protein